jgi:hypothetical protein
MRPPGVGGRRLLAIADRRGLKRVLRVMLDERERALEALVEAKFLRLGSDGVYALVGR